MYEVFISFIIIYIGISLVSCDLSVPVDGGTRAR